MSTHNAKNSSPRKAICGGFILGNTVCLYSVELPKRIAILFHGEVKPEVLLF
jgi:hypothetical protein